MKGLKNKIPGSVRQLFLSLLMVTTISIISACSPTEINLLYAGTNRDGKIAYHYDLFNGKEIQRDNFAAGQNVELDYSAAVEKGSLTFQLTDPQGEILWSETVERDVEDQVSLKIPVDGSYSFSVSGDHTKGSYRLEWPTD